MKSCREIFSVMVDYYIMCIKLAPVMNTKNVHNIIEAFVPEDKQDSIKELANSRDPESVELARKLLLEILEKIIE